MAGDLEQFLREAAKRLAEQVNSPERPPQPRADNQSVRQRERGHPAGSDPIPEDEPILAAEVVDDWQDPRAGPDPLSTLDTRPTRISQVDLADERMEEHLREALDHSPSRRPDSSHPLDRNSAAADQPSDSSQVQHRRKQVSPFIDMFRDPQSLKAAFVAGEIFRRKF
ncbi:MAG: hypothetical protein KatS3mg111_3739 [Pirellulaceae bacterium]|nr:MAG: hypothetical protein KatS3mg111_3739 [Pirellulaceae bacterium]